LKEVLREDFIYPSLILLGIWGEVVREGFQRRFFFVSPGTQRRLLSVCGK
jgi:hypothetical protein